MEMGTGKTRTTLEFIKYRLSKLTKVIWFSPCSVKSNLMEDIKKHSDASVETLENYKNEFIVIVGIESIGQSDTVFLKVYEILKSNPNSFVIIDESHMIKNPNSKRFKRILSFSTMCQYRMILTGTPVTQNMQDLYTQFTFLSPKILGYSTFSQFAKNHIKYSDKFPGMIIQILNKEYLTTKINPYIYQVTKDECLDLLPKKYESIYYNISSNAEIMYEKVKQLLLDEMASDNFDSTTIFRYLGYLQRISCGNFREFISYERSKTLYEVIKNNQDKKIIVFYKYNSDIKLIKKYVKSFYLINGFVSNKKRNIILNCFKKNHKKILLINISSGSYGLNLQFADCLIYFENTFDYAKRIQSEDRIYRIGQEKQVKIIDIIANTGIDRKIINNLNGKGYVAEDLRKNI